MSREISPHRPDASWSRFYVRYTTVGSTRFPRWFAVDTSAISKDRWAQCSAVLDLFHCYWALDPSADFDIGVFDAMGNLVPREEANGRQHDIRGLFLGEVGQPDFRRASARQATDEEGLLDLPSPA